MDSPVFIIGNPRSDTTLLRLALGCHESIVMAPEGAFAVWLYRKFANCDFQQQPQTIAKFVDETLKCRKMETWNLERSELNEWLNLVRPRVYRDVVTGVYEYYAEKVNAGYVLWGDKNNSYVAAVPIIKMIYPKARFLHLVRDGRDVACSYLGLAKKKFRSSYAPILPTDLETIASEWTKNVLAVRSAFRGFDWRGVYEIRFENLVTDLERELRAICRWLEMPYSRRMSTYYQIPEVLASEPSEFHDWKSNSFRPPDARQIGRFRRELKKKEVERFTDIALSALKQYNYL